MSFANHNILDIALSIIPPTLVKIRKTNGIKINKYGQAQAEYSEWIDVYGIVQPGSESNEHSEGIDYSKKHVTIWLRGIALDGTHIQHAPDQILYLGRIFNVINVKDWYPYDNFRECECVEALNLDSSQKESKTILDSIRRKAMKATSPKKKPTAQSTAVEEESRIENTSSQEETVIESTADSITYPNAPSSITKIRF